MCCMWCVFDLNFRCENVLWLIICVIIFLQLLCLLGLFDLILIFQFWCLVQWVYMWNRLLVKIVVLLLLVLVCILRNRLFLLCGLCGISNRVSFCFSFCRCVWVVVIFLLVSLCRLGLVCMFLVVVRLVLVWVLLVSVVVIGFSWVNLCERLWKWVLLVIILGLVSRCFSFLWCLVSVFSLWCRVGVIGFYGWVVVVWCGWEQVFGGVGQVGIVIQCGGVQCGGWWMQQVIGQVVGQQFQYFVGGFVVGQLLVCVFQ